MNLKEQENFLFLKTLQSNFLIIFLWINDKEERYSGIHVIHKLRVEEGSTIIGTF